MKYTSLYDNHFTIILNTTWQPHKVFHSNYCKNKKYKYLVRKECIKLRGKGRIYINFISYISISILVLMRRAPISTNNATYGWELGVGETTLNLLHTIFTFICIFQGCGNCPHVGFNSCRPVLDVPDFFHGIGKR